MKLNLILILIILSSLILSCSSSDKEEAGFDLKRRKIGKYFVGSGVNRYMLSAIPDWMNFSSSGQCERSVKTTYFKLKELKESFSLTHAEAMQFQLTYNERKRELLKNSSLTSLPLKTEESLFFEVTNKIKSGIFSLNIPKYKNVNIVWIDLSIKSEKGRTSLKKLMNSEDMNKGFPIFFSLCHTSKEVESLVQKEKLFTGPVRVIGVDMLSVYDRKDQKQSKFVSSVLALFKKKQRIKFYSTLGWRPIEVKSRLKTIKY